MKGKFIIFFIIFIIIIMFFIGIDRISNNKNDNNKLTKVRVSEVAHSVFYTPQYLADSLGYFENEGLDVEINLTAGADAVMSSVLSGDSDIGFCGTEATIYVVAKRKRIILL